MLLTTFGTGAVRSTDANEFRYDLITPIGLREVARTCAEGAAKYGDFNWEKGMPVHDLLNHVEAHYNKFKSGDGDLSDLSHAAWGALAIIHSYLLWPHLNEGHLRGPRCTPPQEAAELTGSGVGAAMKCIERWLALHPDALADAEVALVVDTSALSFRDTQEQILRVAVQDVSSLWSGEAVDCYLERTLSSEGDLFGLVGWLLSRLITTTVNLREERRHAVRPS